MKKDPYKLHIPIGEQNISPTVIGIPGKCLTLKDIAISTILRLLKNEINENFGTKFLSL